MSDVDDIWRDPAVKEALKERDASDIFILTCPQCGRYGYYNQGSHWSCGKCDINFRMLSEGEVPAYRGEPVIYCGEEITLADTVEFDDGPDGPS